VKIGRQVARHWFGPGEAIAQNAVAVFAR